MTVRKGSTRRKGLTRDLVVKSALKVAADEGVSAVTMRRVGREVGVEAMSLYTYVSTKNDLLNGMVAEICSPEIAERLNEAETSDPRMAAVLRQARLLLIAGATLHGDGQDRAGELLDWLGLPA